MTTPKTPLVSVVIPTYNRAEMIRESLDSVLEQDFDSYEVIVSDDGSTDDTREVLEKYGKRIIVITGENGGCGLARSRAIDIARGQYIANHDSDDIMLPGRLKAQAKFMQDNPEVAAVSGNLLFGEEKEASYLQNCGVQFGDSPHVIYEKPFELLTTRSIMADPATMIRRKSFVEIGGYDHSLKVSADWDLWLRMSLKWSLACMKTPCTWYRVHPGNKSASPLRIATLLRIIDKHLASQVSIGHSNRELLTKRLEKILRKYFHINIEETFEKDWKEKVRYYGRHLSFHKRNLIRALTYMPTETIRFLARHKVKMADKRR
jgi:glycosyltransferase involved in cell wall biosynthesis